MCQMNFMKTCIILFHLSIHIMSSRSLVFLFILIITWCFQKCSAEFFQENLSSDETNFCVNESLHTLSEVECTLFCNGKNLITSFGPSKCHCLSTNCTGESVVSGTNTLTKVEKVKGSLSSGLFFHRTTFILQIHVR